MIRLNIQLLLFLILPCFIKAQVIYSTNSVGDLFAKNKLGKVVAIGSNDFDGIFKWKDNFGNLLTAEIESTGNIIVKDREGNLVSYCLKGLLGKLIWRDCNGLILDIDSRNYVVNINYSKIIFRKSMCNKGKKTIGANSSAIQSFDYSHYDDGCILKKNQNGLIVGKFKKNNAGYWVYENIY